MRRLVVRSWLTDEHREDIKILRAALNQRDIDGSDEAIADAYSQFSDDCYAASWMVVNPGPHDYFCDYVEQGWILEDADAPSTESAVPNVAHAEEP